jgi:hypothetical protein
MHLGLTVDRVFKMFLKKEKKGTHEHLKLNFGAG